MSARTKYLTAALAVVAAIATVAVARTIQTHERAPARETVGIGIAAPRAPTPAQLHGIVGCGGSFGLDCDEVERLLPQ
jgi:hypothetical protein